MKSWNFSDYEREGRLLPKANLILKLLQATPGVVTYDAIKYLVWHNCKPPTPRLLDQYISHIRRGKKLLIRHHNGTGYEFLGRDGIRLPIPRYRPGIKIPPPGYAVCAQRGELMPRAVEVFMMLQSTPGIVTDRAMHHVVWRGLNPPNPNTLRHYMSHIKSVMGVKIRRYAGIGYELMNETRNSDRNKKGATGAP